MRIELKIKKIFLKQIISGEKKEEYREPTNFNMVRLFKVDHVNKRVVDRDDLKEIKFVAGYAKNADYAIVKVGNIGIWEFRHEIPDGFQLGDKSIVIPIEEVIEYKLT